MLSKIAALITIRTAWSHDRKHREMLDRLIQEGVDNLFKLLEMP